MGRGSGQDVLVAERGRGERGGGGTALGAGGAELRRGGRGRTGQERGGRQGSERQPIGIANSANSGLAKGCRLPPLCFFVVRFSFFLFVWRRVCGMGYSLNRVLLIIKITKGE